MHASIVFLRSTDHLAVLIGSIGHCSPPIGTLFGPENIIWDLKPATEAQCVTRGGTMTYEPNGLGHMVG